MTRTHMLGTLVPARPDEQVKRGRVRVARTRSVIGTGTCLQMRNRHRRPSMLAFPRTVRMSTSRSAPSCAHCATTPSATDTKSCASSLTRRSRVESPTGPSSARCWTRPLKPSRRSRKSWSGSSPVSPASASTRSPSSRCYAGAGSASPPSPSTPTIRQPAS